MVPGILRFLTVALFGIVLIGCEKSPPSAPTVPERPLELIPKPELSPVGVLLMQEEADRIKKQIDAAKATLAADRAAFDREKLSVMRALDLVAERNRIEKEKERVPVTAPKNDAKEHPLLLTSVEPVRAMRGGSVLVAIRISGCRSGTRDSFRARSLYEINYDDDRALKWVGGSISCPSWVLHHVAPNVDSFHLRLNVGKKVKQSRHDLVIEHDESGASWRIPVEISDLADESDSSRDEPMGRVVLESVVTKSPGVAVFVDVDGKDAVRWPEDQSMLTLAVKPGEHQIVLRSKYRGYYFRKSFSSVTVSPAGTTHLLIVNVDRDYDADW